jgi:hypothetical protein
VSQVDPVRTPLSDEALIAALEAAYVDCLGHEPKHETLAVLLAQIALETGHAASLICWNLGNYKRGPGPDWCAFETFEYVPSATVGRGRGVGTGTKTSMICEFSAWPDLQSAAAFFVSALYGRWPEAWAGAVAGDPEAFSVGLHARGYYTAPVGLYAAGVRRWFAFYLALLGGDSAVTEPELPVDAAGAAVLGITGLLDAL